MHNMLSSIIREKERSMFIFTFICIEKLSKESLERNEIHELSREKRLGIRWIRTEGHKTFHLLTFYSVF